MPVLFTLNYLKLNFFLLDDWTQTTTYKTNNSSLNIAHSAGSLGFIFDEHITVSGPISHPRHHCSACTISVRSSNLCFV